MGSYQVPCDPINYCSIQNNPNYEIKKLITNFRTLFMCKRHMNTKNDTNYERQRKTIKTDKATRPRDTIKKRYKLRETEKWDKNDKNNETERYNKNRFK